MKRRYPLSLLPLVTLLGCGNDLDVPDPSDIASPPGDGTGSEAPTDPGSPGATPPTISAGGYYTSGAWKGYAWVLTNAASATPTDFSAAGDGERLCIAGSVEPREDYSGIAMLGVNLNQDEGDETVAGTVTPTAEGLTVRVENRGGSPLRVQIQGPNGAEDETDRWCATIGGSGGTIPYHRFNTRCWDGSGDAYAGQPLTSAAILVPGDAALATPFDFCLDEISDGGGDDGPGAPDPGENSGDGVVGYYGELYCGPGAKLHGSKTQSVAQVRGMSFFWSNWSRHLWREDVVDRMVDEFKSELIRLPMGVNDAGTPHSWDDEALVRQLVEHATKRGVYVVIDWHSHGADQNVEAAKEFFGRMARDYGALDNVIFEIFNEPVQQTWEQVKSYAEQVLPVIRAHSDNLVLVGTPMYSQEVDWAAGNPLNDPNVAYVLHFYAMSHHGWLRAKGDTAMNAGKCLFVSEWGATHADGGQAATGNTGIDYGSTTEWLGWMDQNNISWAKWSIMNKDESSSIFAPGTENLSEAGTYLSEILNGYVESNPWR